jgi:hypothetical protein
MTRLRMLQFLAIVLTALALVPGGAHFFELWNKIGLDREAYFTVQHIYDGWALFGIVLFAALGANLLLAVALRRQPRAARLAGAGFALVGLTLVLFFLWVFPANQATQNWTVAPADWERLRVEWEWTHAANAVLTFLALCAVTAAGLAARPDDSLSRRREREGPARRAGG